uniref:Uncharacterized protein n=1 Tax=Piliocolobus tephrosceles TaxID=591936 RepID=A0A8C9GD22_9PRIM
MTALLHSSLDNRARSHLKKNSTYLIIRVKGNKILIAPMRQHWLRPEAMPLDCAAVGRAGNLSPVWRGQMSIMRGNCGVPGTMHGELRITPAAQRLPILCWTLAGIGT